MAKEVKIPDIGGFEGVEVIDVLVGEGDKIAKEDSLITLESDKAAMDVPAPFAGTVRELKVKAGDKVSEGDVILTVEGSEEDGEDESDQRKESKENDAESAEEDRAQEADEKEDKDRKNGEGGNELQDAEGEKSKGTRKRESKKPKRKDKAEEDAREEGESEDDQSEEDETEKDERQSRRDAESKDRERTRSRKSENAKAGPSGEGGATPPTVDRISQVTAHAGPSVRRFARELGVDLSRVKGSGNKSRISHEDVRRHVKSLLHGGAVAGGLPQIPEVDFSRFGEIARKPLSRIKRISGPRLQAAWINAPHVTQHDEADITALETVRKAMNERAATDDAKLTPLAFLMRAVVLAMQALPDFNSSLDRDGENLICRKYFHIGFAVDTDEGLIVPVIRDADRKSIREIAADLAALAEKARGGKLARKDIEGGCFSISSLGSIGGTAFTPIINAPEVAVLGVSRAEMKPKWNGSAFEPRLMLPLSLSYDHRVIDGAQAVRFTRHLAETLETLRGMVR
ncbi:MAG TPA: 2-oxo acid dehydrogenase subunit E2 [Gammaproteobacteria bacterium]|nr:2-oxo acid dehydrogenase subunit E2 [Gammaproteobacteria bacterium]